MANFHVVPRGDAITHETHNDKCQCTVEIRTTTSEDKPGTFDVWYYHREVSLEEAVMREEEVAAAPPAFDPYAEYRVDAP